ncbi:MAG: hypothetical protein EOO61_03705 [Hymenobacter sp.]|jgi:hypothetical protein|nr:MAG: hypothetical protein EOO61_03705 [Hymenobacter sp.]
MGLDICWVVNRNELWLGSLEIDTPLETLLYRFGKVSGIPIDPYGGGRTRLYLTQWEKLVALAAEQGYPVRLLRQLQARIPNPTAEGLLLITGD